MAIDSLKESDNRLIEPCLLDEKDLTIDERSLLFTFARVLWVLEKAPEQNWEVLAFYNLFTLGVWGDMFLVVETVNDKGEKEWKVAPKRWVYSLKNSRRPVLFWPEEISPQQQYHLARERTSKPAKSWSRKECLIKHKCLTYEAASAALEVMLANSTLSASMPLRSVPKQPNVPRNIKIHVPKQPNDPIGVEDTHTEQLSAIIERNANPYLEAAATLADIKRMVKSLMKKTEGIETQNARIEKQNAYIMERNSRIQKDHTDLMKELILIHRRFEYLVSQQIELTKGSVENSSFHIDPVETVEQLDELENKLNDETFFFEMVTLIRKTFWDTY